MIALYLTSMGEADGKSALCAGLGRKFKAEGRRVGFLKPVAIIPEKAGAGIIDKDAEFMKQALDLKEPIDLLCPVSISAKDLAATANEREPAWLKKIREAYAKISTGKDMVLLEGVSGFKAGSDSARVGSRIVEALGPKAILIVRYQSDLEASQIAAAAMILATHLLGVVINAVPQRRMESIKAKLVPSLQQSGVKVLGVLPEDRVLLTVSVGQLAEHLGGSILNSRERSDELVESLMVGAMSPDSALSYLNLKPNKAVITRGDRPDIQLAALESSTRCLVLTGNINPMPGILNRAQELKVPVVLVKEDTKRIMEMLEGVFDKASVHDEKKLERLEQLLEQYLDLEPVYQAM